MFHRLRVAVLLASTPLVLLVLVGGLLGAVRPSAQSATADLRVFSDVVRLIFSAYVEPASVDRVMDGAMRGLTDTLDSSTSYLTPDEVALVEAGTPLPPGEIGVTVTHRYYLLIVGVEDGSPAARAGLRSGDFIRTIDERPTRDMSTFAGERLLRGPVGSTTELLVIRGNAADPHAVTLTREGPRTERAAGRTLADGEAYLRVTSFEDGAVAAIAESVEALGPAADNGLLIDLRDVADGPYEAGIDAARLFVGQGVLATRASRNAPPVVVESAPGDGPLGMPVVLLVSNGTAGAAELFAAALAEADRAVLVGQTTAGLAGVQSLVPLPAGHGLWMTTEQYTLSDGTPIHGRGLRPRVAVSRPVPDFGERPDDADPMLDRARAVLREGPPPGTGDDQVAADAPGAPLPGDALDPDPAVDPLEPAAP